MYETAIVDELGLIVAWTVGMSQEDIDKHLEEYPEHALKCICIG